MDVSGDRVGDRTLWSDDPPDDEFVAVAASVFPAVTVHVVDFADPLTGGTSSNTVYVATGRV